MSDGSNVTNESQFLFRPISSLTNPGKPLNQR
jgi:hypothetical protein